VSGDLSGFSMMELFRMESESHTATLSTGLVSLEGIDAPPEVIEPLMRAAHSLKGAARIVGLDAAVRVAHAMEDCFVAAQKGKITLGPPQVDILLQGVDLLIQIAGLGESEVAAWQSGNEALVDTLVGNLTTVAESPPTATVREPQPPSAASTNPVSPPALSSAKDSAPGAGNVVGTEESAEKLPVPTSVLPSSSSVIVNEPGREKALAEASSSRLSPDRDRDRDRDRVVRVTAESLTRLMSLAGEALVQTHRLPPLVDALWRLKGQQTALLQTVQLLEDRVSSRGDAITLADRDQLASAKSQTNQGLQTLGETVEALEEFTRLSENLSSRLHHEVLASRMRPMADGVRGFPRIVRDMARELGKQARFEIVGETTGVDRDILDRLESPLNHLIRNAIDHGLEMPEERQACGKPLVGKIRLEARHRAGMLQIILSDDGRGIEPERLRTKVVERGLTTAAVASRLSEHELLDFLFLPGFSTREHVTEVSGRGVGLDVVQNMVRAVRGSVRVASRPGKGTRFILQLPITVSVIRALLVEIAGEPYAFPLSRIDRIFMLDRKDVRELEGKPHTMLDDQPVGLVEAAVVLDQPAGTPRGTAALLPVVVASDRSHRFGVVVDRFLGERDLRVSPLDPRLGKVPDINSSSVLENGWPVLVVDVEDLIRSIDNLLSGRRLGKLATDAVEPKARRTKRILVVDDSITVRELERQLLENRGYTVDVAVDGVDGWNAVRTADYDLVVSDVDMPRMDGIQLVQHIKSDLRKKAIPVVIVSYKDREEDRIKGLNAGANAYLTKSSFHDQTFLTTVSDLIGEPRG
jgi:two-component system, chemotaxis family, sensor histidine kinase and response regulator WspE